MNAVITGATKGIGKSIAKKLAENGYNLAICSRTAQDLSTLKTELEGYGIKVICQTADLSRKADVLDFIKVIKSNFKTVEVLVNNVGTFMPGLLLDEEDDSFEIQQNLNLNSAYYLSKHIGKMMREQQTGHIFNICSIASKSVVENAGSYSVTKTALLSLNDVLRRELSPHHVKVTAVLPGSTYTASWEGTTISPEQFVQPEDIANTLHTVLNLSKNVNVDEIILTPLKF